jgi:hypothetical protein
MKHVTVGVLVVLLMVIAFMAGGYAASKSYQFTGVVKAADSGMLTVEKSPKEIWNFEVAGDTKNSKPKVGDRVTVYYKMVATEIEPKPATAATTAPKKK